MGYLAVACATGEEFETALETNDAELVLMDVHLGDVTGIDLLERIRKRGIMIPVVMITGYGDIRMAVRAMKAGAEDFILKPITIEQLEICVQKALRVKTLTQEVQRLREQLKEAVTRFSSPGQAPRLHGRSGLPIRFRKATIRRFYYRGNRARAKNCSPLHSRSFKSYRTTHDHRGLHRNPPRLAENELFGYERAHIPAQRKN